VERGAGARGFAEVVDEQSQMTSITL
jgi:hypothetical protein